MHILIITPQMVQNMKLSFKKLHLNNPLIRATLLLTCAGFLSRIIGFVYKLFITNKAGAYGIGIYQLTAPTASIVFALCSAGIQTGISNFCASSKEKHGWLRAGILISMPLTFIISFLCYYNSEYISTHFLLNKSCAPLLKLLSLSFPFSSLHNCINGYYFGQKKAGIPAFSQLLEQIIRVLSTYIYCCYCEQYGIEITAVCACVGNIFGEVGACTFCIIALFFHKHFKKPVILSCSINNLKKLFSYSLPITSNKLLMHLLVSGETILIPAQLRIFGYSEADALSLYGILTGMALPLIMFPSALTNSLSVMLLPEISGANAHNNKTAISRTLSLCLKFCLGMGFFFTIFFITAGGKIGALIFNEALVSDFVNILAWLCPFIYLTGTLASILNGLGKTTTTFIHNIISILIRICCLIISVPKIGINGYLFGLLLSKIFIATAHYAELRRELNKM